MSAWQIVLIVVLSVIVIALVVLTILGRRQQKKQDAQQEEIKKQAIPMTLFIIDLKKLRLKDSGLPKVIYDNTPRMGKLAKMPIVKAKAGNQVVNLMCDPDVFKTLMPKQEVKAQVAGMYIISAKRVRGPVAEVKKKKTEKLIDKLR